MLTDDKVRTNALVPLPTGYDAVICKEVAGDLSKPAQIEARSPSIGKNKAVTRAATALFMATAPHGSTNKGMEVARLRVACAVPGEQPSQFSEALRRLGENAAYLYNAGENYWFSPIASLNQEADDRAKGLSGTEVDGEIVTLVRAEERTRAPASCACTAPQTILSASTTPMRRRSSYCRHRRGSGGATRIRLR